MFFFYPKIIKCYSKIGFSKKCFSKEEKTVVIFAKLQAQKFLYCNWKQFQISKIAKVEFKITVHNAMAYGQSAPSCDPLIILYYDRSTPVYQMKMVHTDAPKLSDTWMFQYLWLLYMWHNTSGLGGGRLCRKIKYEKILSWLNFFKTLGKWIKALRFCKEKNNQINNRTWFLFRFFIFLMFKGFYLDAFCP